jgi:hypothetical protein
VKKKIMECAKAYWLEHFPIEEMPNLASIIVESYRKNLITEEEAMKSLSLVEKDIKNWIKCNEELNSKEL